MWVVAGPFDDATEDRPKKKVLYPGTSYPIGRGSDLLYIASKTVSNDHGVITVGKHPNSDAANADAIPTLHYTQTKKIATIVRPGADHLPVNGGETSPIKSGDTIYITGKTLNIMFTWVPVNILIRSGVSRDERHALTSSLSLLGIKSSFRVTNPSITHVVFTTIPPSPYTDLKIILPLASAVHFVAPGWLTHIVKRGTMDPDPTSGSLLAEYGDDLDEGKFRPDGAGLMAWGPDQKRTTIFKGVKFHVITTTDTPADLLSLLTTATGGSLTTHPISASSEDADEEWDSKLETMKRKADKHIKKPSDLPPGLDSPFVLVGDSGALSRELGEGRWNGVFKTGIESLGIRMIWLPEIADALFKLDLSYISSAIGGEHPKSAHSPVPEALTAEEDRSLPAFIPSTHPSEPSIEPVVHNKSGDSAEAGGSGGRKLVRRVTKRTTPASEDNAIEVGVRRSTRRSVSVAPAPSSAPAPAPVIPEPPVEDDYYPAIQDVPRTVLKRRVTRRAASKEPSVVPIPPAPVTHAVFASALGTYPEDGSASIPEYDDGSFVIEPALTQPVRALKRRVTGRQKNGGTQSAGQSVNIGADVNSQQSMDIVEVEPPHKKYKALFEGTQQPLESVAEEGEGSGGSTGAKRKATDSMDVNEGEGETMAQRRKRLREGSGRGGSGEWSQPQTSSAGLSSSSAHKSAPPGQAPVPMDASSNPSGSISKAETMQTRSEPPTQTAPTVKKKVQLEVSSQNGNEDGQQQAVAAPITIDPQLQALLQTKSKKTGATAGLDKEFTNLRLTAHPAERLKLEEEERLRRDLEVWKELQQKEKEVGGSLEGVGGARQNGNFMVVVLKDDLVLDKESRRRNRGQALPDQQWDGDSAAVPNFKKFKKKNVAALRGPKIELELPPPVDYGMGDVYWQNNHTGDATIGGEGSNNPLAGSYSQANGGESSNGHRLNLPTGAAQPRQKKQLQLPRVHSSDEEEAGIKPAAVMKSGKTRGKTKALQKKIDLRFSDLEDEDNDQEPQPPKAKPTTRGGGRAAVVEPEDESEIFDLNVSGVDEEDNDDDNDFGSTAGRTVKPSTRSTLKSSRPTSSGPSQSQRSARGSAAVGGTANGKKRKAGGLDSIVEGDGDDDSDDDDSDDGAFKGFGRKKKPTAKKKLKR
ncbi:hypothetical protein FRB93_011159 [Tulasnella sp. JGI-2019a]|nr:hypothetical protein FRB93_011159 [Tulasnella sp. JGI-2019a]